MSFPVPKLDDRNFQDLVDDAKRYIQERCPEWTDHNVSDPGITLVETFAWMTDLLLYRLNRVPERHYVRFLELIGMTRHPPTAAEVDVEFRLSAPQDEPVEVPRGTVVSTRRTPTDESVAFTTTQNLTIQPCSLQLVGSRIGNQRKIRDVTGSLGMGHAIPIYSEEPAVDDAFYLGLDQAIPNHTIVIEFEAEVGGHGINPERPPLRWEAWDGEDWTRCRVLTDETLGLNRSGRVELIVPPGHQIAEIDEQRHAWVRCRVRPTASRPAYRSSPLVASISAYSSGASTHAVNAEFIADETLGVSTGVAGQSFYVRHVPVVPSDAPFVLHVSRGDRELAIEGGDAEADAADVAFETWEMVADFAASGEDDRHFSLDAHAGVVRFGPLIREPDGNTRRHGAIPPQGSTIIAPRYRTGGGLRGNVASGAIEICRTTIPLIDSVINRRAAAGGIDAESIDAAKERGPIELRARNRAVTIEDFEYLAREAAPNLARVKALAVNDGDAPAVQILLVPHVGPVEEGLELRDLVPPAAVRDHIAEYLDSRRLVGTRIVVTPPTYAGLKVRASVVALPSADPAAVESDAIQALNTRLHPVFGGREGNGWPFGRAVTAGEVFSVLQLVSGVDVVSDVELVVVNPGDGAEQPVGDTFELGESDLLIPFEHEISVGST